MTQDDRRTRDFFFRWMIIIGVVNLVILAIMAMGLVANFGSTTDEIKDVQAKQNLFDLKLRASNIISCERGRRLVAWEIVEAGREPNPGHRQQELFNLFPFRDCEKSEASGRAVYLSSAEAVVLVSDVATRMGVIKWDKRTEGDVNGSG